MKRLCPLIIVGVILSQVFSVTAEGAGLPPIREAVFFGDSLTDAGTYGFRFTTGPGFTWAQHMAEHYGQSTEPNEHVERYADVYHGKHGIQGPGGLNYAEGGARVALPYSQVSQDPEGTPIVVEVQLRHFIAQHHAFRPDQIVFLYIGTNDVAYDYDLKNAPLLAASLREGRDPSITTIRAERARIERAANQTAQVARRILHAGARRLVIFELPDLGDFPWFLTPASQAFVTGLSHVFNQRLSARLPKDSRILIIHMQDFLKDLTDHAPDYGIEHGVRDDACHDPNLMALCETPVIFATGKSGASSRRRSGPPATR
jgi:phospholipase/lecithinase/hemolysin